MPVEQSAEAVGPDEQEQRRQAAVLSLIAEQETGRLQDGTFPWSWWLERAARYGRFGFANTLLISAQSRFATDVRSYEAWKAEGRHVVKGERGIRVLSRRDTPWSGFDIAQTQ